MGSSIGNSEATKVTSVKVETPSLLSRVKSKIPPMPWTKREQDIVDNAGQRSARETLVALSGQERQVEVTARELPLLDGEGQKIGREQITKYAGTLSEALKSSVPDPERVSTLENVYMQSMDTTEVQNDYPIQVAQEAHRITHPRNVWLPQTNSKIRIPTGAVVNDMHMVGMHVLEGPNGTRVVTDIADKSYTSDDAGFRKAVLAGSNVTHEPGEAGKAGEHTVLSTLIGPDGRQIQTMTFHDISMARVTDRDLSPATRLMIQTLANQGVLSVDTSGRPLTPFIREDQLH
ncbi:MAG TPA: hypothetical protein VEW42_01905 [Candidatus Eisenbacteria bacterium]|nr:hypothetical protein [Candidatus Eisenbacteria bacterium]